MAAIFVMTFVDRSFAPILPLYIEGMGENPAQVPLLSGILFSVAALGAVAGNQACEALLRRVAPAVVIAGGAVVSAVGLGAFLATGHLGVIAAALLVFGVGGGTAITAAYTVGGTAVPAEAHATGFGFLTGASLAGLALSPVVSGLLSKGHLLAIFAVDLALLAGVALAVFRRMPPHTRE
jgi:MFS family permease